MGSINSALTSSAQALRVMQQAIGVSQNNISNQATPGWARLDQVIIANRFDPGGTNPGGISAGPALSKRDSYAEANVWRRQNFAGNARQSLDSLQQVEESFPISDQARIPASINRLFASFSQLSLSPNSADARQSVLDRAKSVTTAFQQTAVELNEISGRAGQQITQSVRDINRLSAEIATINRERRANFRSIADPGMDTRLHNAIEELSKIVPVTILKQDDGSTGVLLGSQRPLVIGDRQFELGVDTLNNEYRILDTNGTPVTSEITSGSLAGELKFRNSTLGTIQSDLNGLAKSIADRVNGTLVGGLDQNGFTPQADLFTYNSTAGEAFSLGVNNLATTDLAAAASGEPGGNTNAIALAKLANSPNSNGYTFTQTYGRIASNLGQQIGEVRREKEIQDQLLEQAIQLRSDISGVNLDEEAAHLLELQRGFQAVGKVIGVLDELAQTVMGLIR
jgi:flagellar hook-associated protein 1